MKCVLSSLSILVLGLGAIPGTAQTVDRTEYSRPDGLPANATTPMSSKVLSPGVLPASYLSSICYTLPLRSMTGAHATPKRSMPDAIKSDSETTAVVDQDPTGSLSFTIFSPDNAVLQQVSTSTWYGLSGDVRLMSKHGISAYLYFDMLFASGVSLPDPNSNVGLGFTSIGLGVAVKKRLPIGKNRWYMPYVGVGGGLYWNEEHLNETLLTGGATGITGVTLASTSKLNFGYKASIGFILGRHVNFEVAYNDRGTVDALSVRGTTFSIGYNF
jgi:hypothetical protein